MKSVTALMNLVLLTLLIGCGSADKPGADIGLQLNKNDYESLIKKHTRHDLKYEGFYNKYEVYATFLNSEVQTALLQKKSDAQKWDETKARSEREKLFQENSIQTKFAISFFVPHARLNDLHKSASIWKIYLEAQGQRYEGKATRSNNKLEDLATIYPYHNRWSIPYEVIFKVPLTAIESGTVKFIITSTQGTSELTFAK